MQSERPSSMDDSWNDANVALLGGTGEWVDSTNGESRSRTFIWTAESEIHDGVRCESVI